jgi:glyoxylase I family protein
MERVTGIGGMFFRAKDPEALAAWYEEMLGVTQVPGDYNRPPWAQEAGLTVFAPFPIDTVISATHSKSG